MCPLACLYACLYTCLYPCLCTYLHTCRCTRFKRKESVFDALVSMFTAAECVIEPVPAKYEPCENCEECAAVLYCEKCELAMCEACMAAAHALKVFQCHVRCPLNKQAQLARMRPAVQPPELVHTEASSLGRGPALASRLSSLFRTDGEACAEGDLASETSERHEVQGPQTAIVVPPPPSCRRLR